MESVNNLIKCASVKPQNYLAIFPRFPYIKSNFLNKGALNGSISIFAYGKLRKNNPS